MFQTKAVGPGSLIIVLLLSVIGCSCGSAMRGEVPLVSPPEAQIAPTPEPPRVFPSPRGLVNDFADVLDSAAERELEKRLLEFQQNQRIDFATVTVLSTGPEWSIDDYSMQMAKEWKVGSENGGLLMLVSIDDRKWRIQIDRKLESLISNEGVRRIGDLMAPDFKRKDYAAGIRRCVDAMIMALTTKLTKKAENSPTRGAIKRKEDGKEA